MGGGLPSCGDRPPWRMFVSRVLLSGGDAVLSGLSCRSIRYISSIAGTVWGGRLFTRGEWPSGFYSLRQVTEVKLGRVRSDFGWVTSEI